MRAVGAIIALALLSASCGQNTEAPSAATSADVDRSDVVAVAETMMTAFLALDFETVRSLTVPEEQSTVDDLIAAAELGDAQPAEQVDVTATLVERSGTSATLDYDGTYCLPPGRTVVSVTTTEGAPSSGDGSSGGRDATSVIEEPETCFRLSEIFATDGVQFRQIDGRWFGPLPS